jgi:hypothetical protein
VTDSQPKTERIERELAQVRRRLRPGARHEPCPVCRAKLSRRRRSLVMQLAAAQARSPQAGRASA